MEELFGIRYLSRLEFANWQVEQWMRKRCLRAHLKGKIDPSAKWLGELHGRELEQGIPLDLTIRWIGKRMGYGLFTNRPLRAWECIGEYTGILRRRNLFLPNVNDYCFMYPRKWVTLKAFTIDSEKQGNYTRFINHSDLPNCEALSAFFGGLFHIIFRTCRAIQSGEELTYDYGEIYWGRRKKIGHGHEKKEESAPPYLFS